MSIAEIIHAVRALSRGEKFDLAHVLLEDLARKESPTVFKDGQIYPIYRKWCQFIFLWENGVSSFFFGWTSTGARGQWCQFFFFGWTSTGARN